jgi:hypothetical protein
MSPRLPLWPLLAAALISVTEAAPLALDHCGEESIRRYVEPDFDQVLFDVSALQLTPDRAEKMAAHLVRVAYFLSAEPAAAAKAIALAHALVPGHSGAMVANFRLRSGKGPDEVILIDPDEIADDLLGAANLILQCAPSEAADQATACMLEIVSRLPVTQAGLMETQVALGTRLPAANWSSAFPPTGSGETPAS